MRGDALYNTNIAAIKPPIAATPPAMTLPAPAVTTPDVLEPDAEPVDEPVDDGLVVVVRVVWAPLPLPLPLPVAVAAPVEATTVVEVTEADAADVVVVLAALSLLGTLVEVAAVLVDMDAMLLRVVVPLLTTEVEVLPAVIWKGKLYWKMVVFESSWSFRP